MKQRDLAAVLVAARRNPIPFIEQYFYIVNAEGEVQRLVLNQPQRIVAARVVADLQRNVPLRYFILKARREGMSTFIEAMMLLFSLCWSYMRGTVLTHERELSQELMAMSSFFLQNLAEEIKPRHSRLTQDRIRLTHFECDDGTIPLHSVISVDTATGKESGRGKANRFLHLSESAFYPDPGRAFNALLPTVPKRPGTAIFIETTANGMGTAVHERWLEAERGRGMFTPIFIPWFWLDMNTLPVPEDFRPQKDELELIGRFGLTDSQLYWRRMTLIDDFDGDLSRFCQEHPATPDEAWRHSGSPAFSKAVLILYKESAKEERPEIGTLAGNVECAVHETKDIAVTFRPDVETGQYEIYERPVPGEEYIIGADTALGVPDGDASSAVVIRRQTNRIVATWWGKIDPRSLAYVLARLGYWYNTAILAPETNNTGLPTLIELHEHLFYPNIYRWRRYDNAQGIWTNKLGWTTLAWTRSLLLDDMIMGLNQRVIGIPSLQVLDELMVVDADSETPADDDMATAAMIAWHTHLVSPMANGLSPRIVLEPPDGVAPVAAQHTQPMDHLATRLWDEMDRAIKRVEEHRRSDGILMPAAPAEPDQWDWLVRMPS